MDLGSVICPLCQQTWEGSTLITAARRAQKAGERAAKKTCTSWLWGECPAATKGLICVDHHRRG